MDFFEKSMRGAGWGGVIEKDYRASARGETSLRAPGPGDYTSLISNICLSTGMPESSTI